jgi:hypothetical protein
MNDAPFISLTQRKWWILICPDPESSTLGFSARLCQSHADVNAIPIHDLAARVLWQNAGSD